MGDDTSYSQMTGEKAIQFLLYNPIPVSHMIEQGGLTLGPDAIAEIKETVYDTLLQYLKSRGVSRWAYEL